MSKSLELGLLQDYRAGRLLTGQLKARCIKVLQEFTGTFQEVCYRSTSPEYDPV